MVTKHIISTIKENKVNTVLTLFFGVSMLYLWIGFLTIPVDMSKWMIGAVAIAAYQSVRFFSSGMAELECEYTRKVIQEELDTERAMRIMAGEKH